MHSYQLCMRALLEIWGDFFLFVFFFPVSSISSQLFWFFLVCECVWIQNSEPVFYSYWSRVQQCPHRSFLYYQHLGSRSTKRVDGWCSVLNHPNCVFKKYLKVVLFWFLKQYTLLYVCRSKNQGHRNFLHAFVIQILVKQTFLWPGENEIFKCWCLSLLLYRNRKVTLLIMQAPARRDLMEALFCLSKTLLDAHMLSSQSSFDGCQLNLPSRCFDVTDRTHFGTGGVGSRLILTSHAFTSLSCI